MREYQLETLVVVEVVIAEFLVASPTHVPEDLGCFAQYPAHVGRWRPLRMAGIVFNKFPFGLRDNFISLKRPSVPRRGVVPVLCEGGTCHQQHTERDSADFVSHDSPENVALGAVHIG